MCESEINVQDTAMKREDVQTLSKFQLLQCIKILYKDLVEISGN